VSPSGTSFGRILRERRTALGLTQARVAAAAGIPTAILGRWERDESRPVPAQIDGLRGVLQLSDAEAALWGSWLTPPPPPPEGWEVSVEMSREAEIPEEWLPPRERIRPPELDRRALAGRRGRAGLLRHLSAVGGDGKPDPFDGGRSERDERVREVVREGIERRAERRRDREQRRRERSDRLRAARHAAEQGGDGAFALPNVARGAAESPAGRGGPSSHVEGYLSIANTGSAFPIPGDAKGRQGYPYGDAGPAVERDWRRYLLRTLALLVVLGALAALAVWAIFELGEGWSAVIDLFRNDSPGTSVPRGELTDALGMSRRF
jgi:transcriptional regulator with XRE-family HTH domain